MRLHTLTGRILTLGSIAATLVLVGACLAHGASTSEAERFATPEAAVDAFRAAMRSGDSAALTEVFGPEISDLTSGDEVKDKADFDNLAKAMEVSTTLERSPGGQRCIVDIGADNWPFPIPIVMDPSGQWYFDTAAGKQELLDRHIGEDELVAIEVCSEYVRAQSEYASEDRDGDEVLEFAQRLLSSGDARDGLYWEAAPDEQASPFGPLVAYAQAVGYSHGKPTESRTPEPFYGYVFRVLTRQGAKVPGGEYDYVINGNMIGGFALIAYPIEYGRSGIMTFVVNQQRKVHQKDLGQNSAELAREISEYNPDDTWTLTKDRP